MAERGVGQYFLLFEIFFVFTFNHNFGKCWKPIEAQNWWKKSTVPPTPKAKKVKIQVVQLFSLSLFFLWRLKETKSKIGKENHFRPISSPPQKWEFYHVYLFSFSFNIIIRNSLQIWSFFSHKIRDLDKITESFYRMNSSVRIILQLYLALAPAKEWHSM